jgi:FkbM family methyltransferase
MVATLDHQIVSSLWPIRFRGKARLLDPLVPREGSREGRVFGYRMTLDLCDLMERMIYLGTYEREETGMAWRWLRPGMTFLDVGANAGYFTLLASRRVGQGGRVIAVEPGPYVHGRLARVVAANGLKAELHQIGLSDRDGTCTLYLPPEGMHNHSPTMARYDGAGGAVDVPVRRLDDCLEEWRVGSVDLLKIDVEGHEGKVFAGAERALGSGRIKAILCEFNDYWLRETGTTPQDVHDTLTGLGFVDQGGAPHFEPGCIVNRFLVDGLGKKGR